MLPARWIGDYFRHALADLTQAAPDALVDSGELIKVRVEGWPGPVTFIATISSCCARRRGTLTANVIARCCRLSTRWCGTASALSPCLISTIASSATPRGEAPLWLRFTLPILVRDALVGRLDARRHRDAGVFEVRALHLEPHAKPSAALREDVADAIARCARWHGTPQVRASPTCSRRDSLALLRCAGASRIDVVAMKRLRPVAISCRSPSTTR